MTEINLDVGDNITKMLENLSHQIGTTADKIFPWYVKQAIIEGWMFLICNILALTVGIVLIRTCCKKANWERGNLSQTLTIVGFVLVLIAFPMLLFGLGHAVSCIINPNYAALHQLTADLSMLTGK